MNFVGQTKLINKINSIPLNEFPHSLILLGQRGCGKKLMAKLIAEKLNMPLVDITNNLSYQYIEDIYQKALPAIYMIDSTKITEKEQNTFLKFIEEPLNSVYVIIICKNKTDVLETVLNRCQIFEFNQYSREELTQFISPSFKDKSELILNIFKTPGRIKDVGFIIDIKALEATFDLCLKIADNIKKANYANTLTIANKIDYEEVGNNIDIDTFFDSMIFVLFKRYIETNDNVLYKLYKLTIEERKKLKDTRLNKDLFMNNYLTMIWKTSRGIQ